MNNDSRNIGLKLIRLSFHFSFIYLFFHSFIIRCIRDYSASALRSRLPEGYPRKKMIKIFHLPRLVNRHL